MRIRMLVDVELTQQDIALMQERIGEQPPVEVSFETGRILRGRLMGATPVEAGE